MPHWKRVHFKDLKLRTKFMISFVLIISISLALSSLLNYYTATQSIKNLSSQDAGMLLEQVAFNVQQRINDVEEQIFQAYVSAGFCEYLTQESPSRLDKLLSEQRMKEFLYQIVYSNSIFPFAMIYSNDGKKYTQLRPDAVLNPLFSDFELSIDERMKLLEKRGKVIWKPGNSEALFLERAMYDVQSSAYCGSLVLAVDESFFKSIFPSQPSSGEIMFVSKEDGLLIYRDDDARSLYQAWQIEQEDEFVYQDRQYVVTIGESGNHHWKLLNIVAVDQLTAHLKDVRYWVLISFGIAFLFAFLNAAVLSRYITKRLSVLVSSMKNVAIGVMETTIRSDAKDEIGLLAERFNMMVGKIKELIHTVGQEKLQKEQAEYKQLEFEYKALQAQMNPHFLYNTLESIQSLAMLSGQQEVSKMIYLLGRLMRENISRKGDFVTLEEELDVIRDYLTLQSIIYDSKLEVTYDVDASLLDWAVPRLILQPIVENAIVHGIEKKVGTGKIKLCCYDELDSLVVVVEDNGVGMTEEVGRSLLDDAYQMTEHISDQRPHTRVGVRSVNKRLKILFGSEYGLSIESVFGEGTRIMIRQPKVRKEDIQLGNQGSSV